MRLKATAAALVAAFAINTSTAHAARTPSQALANLAQQATHGWADDRLPLPVLEHKLNRGERIYITCGTISRLAARKLHRMDVPARVVGSYTFDRPDGFDDGHIMIEAHVDGRWQVWDLDNNRKPVDAAGHGINVTRFVVGTDRYTKIIATDREVDYRGRPDLKKRFGWVHGTPGGLDCWYDHILGVPTIETQDGWTATTADPRMFMSMSKLGYRMLTRTGFAHLES